MTWAEIIERQRALVGTLALSVFELNVQANFKMPPKLPHFAATLEQEHEVLRAMGRDSLCRNLGLAKVWRGARAVFRVPV